MTPEEELSILKKKNTKRKRGSKYVFFIMVGILFGLCFGLVVNVSAAHDNYAVRPTIDSNPTHQADYKMQQEYGYLKVILRCAGNTLNPSFIITNLDAKVSKSYLVDPNGQFDEEFSVGNYSAYLPDGNGGQPEPIQYFTINPQKTSYVVFLGHAISQPAEPEITAKPTVQPTPTQHCHWHNGYWKRVCIRHHCFNVWIPGYWDCGGCFN